MAVSEKILEMLRSSMILSDKVGRITDEVKALSEDVRQLDRRIVRLETYVEIGNKQRANNPILENS
ncbi:MAG: hypothetical protein OEZ58_06065 [Gammaproteobacteria bacterium]|nr:hypothetical protein [Gammaproteobacteria bacterium]MDH5728534.1 hypothetical protein [Gammaproteobacteria bacterium]